MLHDLLNTYLESVGNTVTGLEDAYIERYEEEILGENRINLRLRIRFNTGYLLEVNEAIVIEDGRMKRLNYRYHFQDEQNTLIFRYDNTPHFKNIESYPHHKHIDSGVVSAYLSDVNEAIREANQWVK